MRNWITIEESKINEYWNDCANSIENVFKSFRYIELSYSAFKIDYTLGTRKIEVTNGNLDFDRF